MARTETSEGKWSVAAALGLMAVALVWDRIVPPEHVVHSEEGGKFPEDGEAERDATPAETATEGGDRGRNATRPPTSRQEDGRISSGASTATSATTESSPWLPA